VRFDRVAIPLAPRSTANCLDLALCFLRRHFTPISALWASIALPACIVAYVLIDRYEFHLPLALAVLVLATSPLGVVLMAGAAPAAFGEPFTFRGTWSRLGRRGIRLVAWGLALRIVTALGFLCFVFPGWYVAMRTGFFVEQWALSNMDRHLHDRRAEELLKGEIGDLYVRSASVFLYCALLWLVLLVTADAAATHLLGLPLLFGRLGLDWSYLGADDDTISYVARFVWSDPVVLTTALAVALLVYPFGRLAWFLCYVDVRVRRDCWDMELQIVQEAARLEAAGELQAGE